MSLSSPRPAVSETVSEFPFAALKPERQEPEPGPGGEGEGSAANEQEKRKRKRERELIKCRATSRAAGYNAQRVVKAKHTY